MRPLVVTGASGFVGRAVVDLLRAHDTRHPQLARRVTLLLRNPANLDGERPLPSAWRVLRCDLEREAPPPGAIDAGSVVLHLAAATGKLPPAVMRAVNVDGTRRLAEAAVAAGAGHLVYVSSIAASFADRRWYHYAEAKREAEAIVAGAGIAHSIVRPTMVFGAGSPVQEGLQRLALGGAPIVLGSGAVQLQPIDVEDLATFLVALGDDVATTGATSTAVPLEVGGGERLSLRALLARMRLAHTRDPREPWGVPIGALRRLLGIAEAVLGPRLPVTAGQLASFVNDSTAAPNPIVQRLLPEPRPLTRTLLPEARRAPVEAGRSRARGEGATDEVLAREFGVWSRYLGTAAPEARAVAAYVRAHPSAALHAGDRFDRTLVSVARRSPAWCALADSYARRVRPYGTLRRKLVLALAVLESTPRVHAGYDTAKADSRAVSWLALAASGAGWAVRTAVAVVLLLPLHLASRLGGTEAERG